MDNIKNDKYYIEKTIENIDIILNYINGRTYNEFVSNEQLIDATMFRLVQMVESLNHISLDYKKSHPTIKWGLIIGFRNGIVHDYGKTDYSVVFDIITKDIIDLKNILVDN